MKNHSNEVLFEFDLPEFKRDEIKVKFHNSLIYIIASKRTEIKEERKGFMHDETTSKSFEYKATLPESAYTKNAKIEFEKGVLKIRIPKK